jgi:cysteine-rich repeat protein
MQPHRFLLLKGRPRLLLLGVALPIHATACALDVHGFLDRPPVPAPDAGGGGTAGHGVGGGGVGGAGGTEGLGGAGGLGGDGGSGGSGPVCGDGILGAPEACDDGNDASDDGCVDCAVTPGYLCNGAPSKCTLIQPQVVSVGPNLGIGIPDGSYDGSLDSMGCATVQVDDAGYDQLQSVQVTVAIDHVFLGDLIIKVQSPDGTITTLMNRPGLDEPEDKAYEPNGDDSNLESSAPITFQDGAPTPAEGDGLDHRQQWRGLQERRHLHVCAEPGQGPGDEPG